MNKKKESHKLRAQSDWEGVLLVLFVCLFKKVLLLPLLEK